MSKYGSPDVSWFTIAGLNVVGTLTEFEDRREARTERNDALGDSWEEHTWVGVREGEITQTGFYDDAAGSIHDILSSGPGATNILVYCLEGTATGKNFVGWTGGVQINYQRMAERDALIKARATYKSNGRVEQGKTLWPYKSITSTGRKNTVDNGVSSTGGAGYLSWNSLQGEANIRILHSSDDLSFADLFVFSKIAAGHGAERLTTTGVIERYTAADFTTASATGAVASGELTAFVGLARGLV